MAEFKNELRLRNGVTLRLDLDGNLHMTGATPVCTIAGADLEALDNFIGAGLPAMKMAASREAKVQEANRRHRLGLPPEEEPEPEPKKGRG